MNPKLLCAACAAALLSLPALAQTQSGSAIGSRGPSTGTSADTAGAAGTTAPRTPSSAPQTPAPETSAGTSGATAPPAPTRTSGLCDTLTGDARIRCQREQAATGSPGGGATGSAGPGSTGMSPGR